MLNLYEKWSVLVITWSKKTFIEASCTNNIHTGEKVLCTEAVVRRGSVKKVFLKISQNLQESTCAS